MFLFKISSFLDFLKRVCIWIEMARQPKVSLEGESFFRGGRATSGGRCEGKYGGKLASLNVIHVCNKLADAIMLNFTKIQHI